MLDVKRMRILREVAAQGSFSAAAEALYLSQSAVSQQVAKLEAEAGVELLKRTNGGPKPTAAGKALIAHAEAVMCRLEEAERELAEIAGLGAGSLRIVTFPSASVTIVTRAAARFRDAYPGVALTLSEAEPEESLPQLRAGEHEVAVVFDFEHYPFPPDRDIDLSPLVVEQMSAAVCADHPLAGKDSVRIEELRNEPWLAGTTPGSCTENIRLACKKAGFDPRIDFQSNDYTVMKGMIAEGLGVTLLPDLALEGGLDGIAILPVKPKPPVRRVWAATLAAGSRSPATEAMIELLVETAAAFEPRSVARVKKAA
jgi:DNA-binding transcriptional LysR family regulator